MGWRQAWAAGAAAIALAATMAGCEDKQQGLEADPGCAGGKCDEPTTGTGGADGDPESRDSDPHSACEGSSSGGWETDGDVPPWDPQAADVACDERRLEAFNPNRQSFQRDFLRWSCLDVDGRSPTQRGQEYCEYFAIVQLPDAYGELGDPQVLGANKGSELEDGQTPFGLDLSKEERQALIDDPNAVVGQCVFTSWNADIDAELPDRKIQGEPLSADVFRMKYFANTNDAAQCLIEECMEFLPPHEEVEGSGISLDDDFTRGCFLNSFTNETHDRKSDSIICSSSMRLAECGCGLTVDASIPEALAPADVLGFRLGSWESKTSAFGPCERQDLGKDNGSSNLITCPITAHQVLNNASEVKAFCQETYADEVVVHIDVAAQAVLCSPDTDADPYAASCSEQPWALEE